MDLDNEIENKFNKIDELIAKMLSNLDRQQRMIEQIPNVLVGLPIRFDDED